MITQQSLSKEIKCHQLINTKGLDILCIAIELDELESSDKPTNYCTLIENSSNNNVNVANQWNYKKYIQSRTPCSQESCTINKVKNIGRKLCSHEGCTSRSRGDGLCLKHGSTRTKFVVCKHEDCKKKAQSVYPTR